MPRDTYYKIIKSNIITFNCSNIELKFKKKYRIINSFIKYDLLVLF